MVKSKAAKERARLKKVLEQRRAPPPPPPPPRTRGPAALPKTCQFFGHLFKHHTSILVLITYGDDLAARIASAMPDISVIALHPSQAVVNMSAQRNTSHNCTYQVLTGGTLPFASSSFQLVILPHILIETLNPTAVLQEARRVCASGGFVICREPDLGGIISYPDHYALACEVHKITETTQQVTFHVHAGRMLLKWACDAGFSKAKISFSMGFIPEEDLRTFKGMLSSVSQEMARARAMSGSSGGRSQLDEAKVLAESISVFENAGGLVYAVPFGQIIAAKS